MARERRSAEQTRELMIEAGMEMLQARGVSLGLEHITLEAACREKDIPRSSSHSAWAIDDRFTPQEMFQREVVRSWLFEREGTLFADAAQQAVAELLGRVEEPKVGDVLRAGVQAAFAVGMGDSPEAGDFLSTDMALRFAIASQPADERDPELLQWLSEGEQANRQKRVEDSYRPLAALVGREPRPEFGDDAYEIFSVVVAALVEGLSLRTLLMPDVNLTDPIPGTENDAVPANVLGACLEALAPVFFQPIADEDS